MPANDGQQTRGAMVTCKCKNCGGSFEARVADRKRGWARFCSKSCKAIKQEKRTGQYRARQEREPDTRDDHDKYLDTVHPFSSEGLGQWQD